MLYWKYGWNINAGEVMATRRTTLSLTIDPELRDRCKAAAALKGKTLKQWVIEAMNERLERELLTYSPDAYAQIQPARGSLKDYLELAKELNPVLQRSATGGMDAAKDIKAAREERLKRIGG